MMCAGHEDHLEVIRFQGSKDRASATFTTVYACTKIKIIRVIKPKEYGNKETWIECVVLSVPKATRRRHPLEGRHLYLYWHPKRFTLDMSAAELEALKARVLAAQKADNERMAKLHDQYLARTKAEADAKAKAKK
jgi:hypothetical protein